jgi:glycosyltransferase involved in cell wall biosynthesis
MRIYLSSGYRYPGRLYGLASHDVHDDLAQGLAELGHEVRYQIQVSGDDRLPDGVVPVSALQGDEDIVHHLGVARLPKTSLPWVRTSHSHVTLQGLTLDVLGPQDIAVSRTLARMHGSERFVYNGIIPDNFIYSESKDDFFLFVVGGIKRAEEKGLEIAFRISEVAGVELRVAATGDNPEEIEAFNQRCRGRGAVFLGAIRGQRKAEAFAAARAVLFPSQLNEAFGLVIAEAWMSGTPVIASSNGAIPEILDPAGGFVCRTDAEYLQAVTDLDRISPRACREMALNRFHYLMMARAYLNEYQRELGA